MTVQELKTKLEKLIEEDYGDFQVVYDVYDQSPNPVDNIDVDQETHQVIFE